MRFKTSWIAVGMAMAASAAIAQQSRLDIRVSKDGVNWSSSVTVNWTAGDSGRVYIGYFMTYVGGVAPNAFASLTFQPTFSNIRAGVDTIAAFANQGNNTNGGAIDPRLDYSAPGGFGRLKPWAATGPLTSQTYVVHSHAGGSGGAPAGNYYRIARNDVTRWMGTGATSGTAAVNNFNGAGGVVTGQKQVPGAADPARVSGHENLLLMVLAMDTGIVPAGTTHTILATAPTDGMSRNSSTGAREASWYANTTENAPSLKAQVVVNDAEINIIYYEEPCRFVTQPSDQVLAAGQSASFSVGFGRSNQQYQWRRNGVALVSGGRIIGATSPNLSISSVSTSDEGTYDCIVTGSCGAMASNPATLSTSTCPDGWVGSASAPFGNRKVHGQAYSAVNGGTLLFGGTTPSNTALGDTWLLAAGQWRQLSSSGPAPRAYLAMAPLPNGRVLLFGGQTVVNSVLSSQGDTWEWNGASWTRLDVSGPSPRAGHTMVLDTARNRVVLFGGLDAASVTLQDTWEWTGTAWTRVATSGPPPSFGQASAYDPVWGETVIFGGAGTGSSQTWAWNGVSWRQAATAGVTARNYPAMAFDDNLGRIVLFGGFAGGADVMGDSYLWTGSAWTPTGIGSAPSPRWNHGLSFDRSAGTLVITAGTGYGQIPLSDWNVLSNRPQPVSQPVDPVVQNGGTATFTFNAAGSSMSYRWRRNGVSILDGGNVTGSAYPTMTIAPVGPSDQGTYDCVISSPCGNLTSLPATLSCRPAISTHPVGGVFRAGQAIELSVQATAGAGATYRWRKDGANISDNALYAGSTTSRLTINASNPSDGGSYSLSISNSCGTTVSNVAVVEVTCPADFNDDGGTDGQDLFEFFDAWANGASSADINFDGGTDGSDVTAFFQRWEAGC